MQEEVTQKTIALSMKTGKLTAQALQAALKKYLQHRAKGPKLHHGKQSLKQLKAHGAALTNIEVTEANIGAFNPCAKKYGVDFTLRKDKTTQPPHYIVIFKAKDADNLEQAFREFTAKTLSKEQRPSIRKVLTAAKQKAAQQPKRAKEKIKQRVICFKFLFPLIGRFFGRFRYCQILKIVFYLQRICFIISAI